VAVGSGRQGIGPIKTLKGSDERAKAQNFAVTQEPIGTTAEQLRASSKFVRDGKDRRRSP
jgi:hypothetical protein